MPDASPVHRVGVVALRVLRQLARDKRTIAMILVQPVIMMAVFGFAFASEATDVTVAVANLDRGHAGRALLDRLDPEVVIVVPYGTETEVRAAVERQDARAGIVVPANFTRNLLSEGSGAEAAFVVVYEDNTNPQVTGAVLEEVGDAYKEVAEAELDRDLPSAIEERQVFGGEDASTLDFLVPGVVGFTVSMMGSMLTVVSIVKERTSGTLQRILASPTSTWEFVLGLAAAFSVFAFLQANAVLLIATFLFGVAVQGPFALALVVTFLISLTSIGLGILLSGLAKNEFQATQSVILVVFPSMFLAGVFAPLESMPEYLRVLSNAVPLTYAVEALRAVINHGAGVGTVARELLALGLFGAGFLAIAGFSFGRRGG